MKSKDDTDALVKRIEMLEQELAAERKSKIHLKVSQKGAVQINGLRRLPITLYRSEIETILKMRETIVAFIDENKDELALKGTGLEN